MALGVEQFLAAPARRHGKDGLPGQLLDLGAANLDTILDVEHILPAQQGESPLADKHWQRAGGAQPELPVWQQADVLDGVVEVRGGLVEVAVVNRAEPVDGLRFEQVARLEIVLGQYRAAWGWVQRGLASDPQDESLRRLRSKLVWSAIARAGRWLIGARR